MMIVRRRDLLAAGFTRDEVRRGLRTGELVPVRRGAYSREALPRGPDERHRLQVSAVVGDLAAEIVVSHVSAVVLHQLPTWGMALDRVHATRARRTGGRCGRTVHLHTAPLGPDEIAMVDGIAVTAPARTVVDVARTAPFDQALVVADRALAAGLVTPEQLDDQVIAAAGWPGAPAARRVVAFADARSESVGESRSRAAIAGAGLPAPVLQWEVRAGDGRRLGRTDFGWPDRGVVGEFDGRAKYGRLLRPGQEPGDAVFAEKRREDALRAVGLRVVRWTWADLDDFDPVAVALRAALS
jgi:hypothetical protein